MIATIVKKEKHRHPTNNHSRLSSPNINYSAREKPNYRRWRSLLIALQTKRKEAGALCEARQTSMILSADDGGLFPSRQEKKRRGRKREEKESVRQRARISRKMKRDDDNDDYRVEDLQSLSENGKAMRERGRWEKRRALGGWKQLA